MSFAFSYHTTLGTVWIAENGSAITALHLGSDFPTDHYSVQETPLLKIAALQLTEYLQGTRTAFDLPLFFQSTPFVESVWHALCRIPYGTTCSYKDIAVAIGNPKACRAVGMANNRNPIAIIVPCHRVIGTNKKLVGYAGGLALKEKLLDLETMKN